ncbi:MAG: ribonuclease P protein component [Ruminococcaceae bacterium]|jgi:ribonuclease P protein component|nr:ribonuclease P protein component [Oscillospiraceae bacterium]
MKHHSLKENHLFRAAYRKGGRKSTDTVTVYVMKDRSAGLLRKQNPMKQTVNRVGISASKKVGGAVQRNRAKRVIREALRQIERTAGLKKGYLIVIVPKPACTVCKMQDVQSDLLRCLSALSLTAVPQGDPESVPEPAAVRDQPGESPECAMAEREELP